jgi:hypothetical protein
MLIWIGMDEWIKRYKFKDKLESGALPQVAGDWFAKGSRLEQRGHELVSEFGEQDITVVVNVRGDMSELDLMKQWLQSDGILKTRRKKTHTASRDRAETGTLCNDPSEALEPGSRFLQLREAQHICVHLSASIWT